MTRTLLVLCGAALAVGCGTGNVDPGHRWVGELSGKGDRERLEVTFDSVPADTGAAISLGRRVNAVRTSRLVIAGRSIRLSAPLERDTLQLDGRFVDDHWEGTAVLGADTSRFLAVSLMSGARGLLAELAGSYRAADGGVIGIGMFTEFGVDPFLIDYRSGRIGPLFPVAPDRLRIGKALIAPVLPFGTVEITRDRTGSIAAIAVRDSIGPPRRATRIPTRDTTVTFANGPVTLAGTVTFPDGPGPHPGIVLVHGSNAQSRETFGPWQRFFAAEGFAVLAYDKRGVGSSTGDWKTADFPALAGDALAGLRLLAKLPAVRKGRVGLWGISQGGWILPRVAAEAPDEVAFLVVHAGTGTTVREQGILNLRQELRASGLSDAEVAVGLAYRMLDDRVTETGKGIDSLRGFYRAQSGAHPWLWPPSPPDAWFRGYYRMLMPHDPSPDWRRVKAPVLLFFGAVDVNVPPAESWPPIERALAAAGNRRVRQVLLPRANHVFLEARTGGSDEYPGLERFVPGYFDRMAAWLATWK